MTSFEMINTIESIRIKYSLLKQGKSFLSSKKGDMGTHAYSAKLGK
jgi:hypothetical protein